MIKYAKIINEEKGLCEVGIGTNTEFYKSLGMEQFDVKQSEIDSQWYLSEKCPSFTSFELLTKAKEMKLKKIDTEKEKAFKQGIIFNGNLFDCDDRAQDRTGNRLLLLNAMPVETLEWLDFTYKPVKMTASEFQELCAAIFERVQFIEFKTGQLIDAVAQSNSIENLDTIEIDFTQVQENTQEVQNDIQL